jgi:PAS domain S-box-containing protein
MPTSAATAELKSLASILDLANVIIHEIDGRILYWTTGCERLYGWRRKEAVGDFVQDLLKTEYPMPRCEVIAKLRAEGAWQGEIEHHTKDGSVVSISSLWVARKSDDGLIHSVLQNNSDITGLKRAQDNIASREAHLRSILETVPEAMVVIDIDGSVTSFSAAATQLFGYRAEEVLGRNVKMLMPEPYRSEHDSYIGRYLRTGDARIIGLVA